MRVLRRSLPCAIYGNRRSYAYAGQAGGRVASGARPKGAAATAEAKAALTSATAAWTGFYKAEATWFGVNNIAAGLYGIPVSFIVTILVSLMTAAPSREMQGFIEQIRIPRGGIVMADARRAD